jgi:hypothetical protein
LVSYTEIGADAIRFNHAPWESLKRQNLLIWLSWSCFNLPLDEAQKTKRYITYLDDTLRTLEARTGMTLPEGYNPDVSILRLTLDPVNVRPNDSLGTFLTFRPKEDLCCSTPCRTVSMPG